MKEKRIKSGEEVLDEFLRSLDSEPGVDEMIKQIIRDLRSSGKLTETKLEQELQKVREELHRNDKD